MNAELNLYYGEQLVGHLSEDDQGVIQFCYASSWLDSEGRFAISHSLPLVEKVHTKSAQNYFANLLPEGNIRTATASRLGVSSENDFRLLEALGGDCAGAFTIGSEPPKLESRYHELNLEEVLHIFETGGVVFSSFQEETLDTRLSLAGAQDKIPLLYENGRLWLPQGNSPSSHILKVPSKTFKHLPENECFIGILGRRMGLEIPPSQLLSLKDLKVYLVARYDRVRKNGKYIRIHQEDFCQALSYSYKRKYEKDFGPKFAECYQALENCSSYLPDDLERLVKWLVFNVLVGNCDAHAKNISLLMTATGVWRLSPHYDIVCTKIYPRLSTSLAMSIGGAYDSGTITGTHWELLANEISTSAKFIKETVQSMADKSEDILKESQKEYHELYGKTSALDTIKAVVMTQRRRLLSQLKK